MKTCERKSDDILPSRIYLDEFVSVCGIIFLASILYTHKIYLLNVTILLEDDFRGREEYKNPYKEVPS